MLCINKYIKMKEVKYNLLQTYYYIPIFYNIYYSHLSVTVQVLGTLAPIILVLTIWRSYKSQNKNLKIFLYSTHMLQ